MARPKLPARLEKRGDVWYLIDGARRISTHTSDRREAERALAQYLAAVSAPRPPSDPNISDLVRAYRSFRQDEKRRNAITAATDKARRAGASEEEIERAGVGAAEVKVSLGSDEYILDALDRHLGALSVRAINNNTARHYVKCRRTERARLAAEARAEGKKIRGGGAVNDTTIARELTILRAAVGWADSEGRAEWFGATGAPTFLMPVRTVSEPRTLCCTREQAAKLIECAPMPHLKIFLRIGFATGARKEAIERLTWDMVDFDRGAYGAINFGAVEHRKRRPWIGMTPELHDHMVAAYNVRCCEHVIEYRGVRAGNVKKGIARAAVLAGLPWFTSHIMKHSFVTWLASGGGDKDRRKLVEEIADIVNTTPATLKRHYRHLFAELDDDMVATLTLGAGGKGQPKRYRDRGKDNVVSIGTVGRNLR